MSNVINAFSDEIRHEKNRPTVDPAMAKARSLVDMGQLVITHKDSADELLAACQAVIDAEALTHSDLPALEAAEAQVKAERTLAVVAARARHALEHRESDAVIAWRAERPALIEKAHQALAEVTPELIGAAAALRDAELTLAAVVAKYRDVTLPAVQDTARRLRNSQGQPVLLTLHTVNPWDLQTWIREWAAVERDRDSHLSGMDLAAFEAFVTEQLLAMGSRFASA